MKIDRLPILDQLVVADARCLGALFTTFTFDPSFFEHHVLASVLRVGTDPDEQATAYHEEALATLQETPVACFVDASMRVPGHQLPYDLREIRGRCFHPKVALLLYEGFARVAVGSANLTKQGYGRNAETVLVRNLVYGEPADAAVLRDVAEFFSRIDDSATPKGTQTTEVLAALQRRIAATPVVTTTPSLRFLHTEADTPLLAQVLALLPQDARITRLGVLAPFYERDDVGAATASDISSVLLELARRAGKDAVLDLGVAWDEAPIAPSTGDEGEIAARLESIWAMRYASDDDDEDAPDVIRYFVPVGVTASNYRCINRHGATKLWSREQLDEGVSERQVWHVGKPRVFAPANLVSLAREHVADVRVWLHPSSQLHEGRPIERPLHAKLLTVAFRAGRKARTLVVVGSANASRMALLATPADAGNVEAGMAFVVDDELTLEDLSPELSFCAAPIEWQERTFPELKPLPSVPDIESAVYSPRDQTLVVTWAPASRDVSAWSMSYTDISLARGDQYPDGITTVKPFRLSPSSCELTVSAHDGDLTFPIVVDDLGALPLDGFQRAMDLRELLALVGRRLTPARHRAIAQNHGPAVLDATLTSLLGDHFGPTDVLRAWWSVAHDLAAPGISVAGFRLRLLGTLGAGAVWKRIYELAVQPGSGMRPEEAWFYGSELRRALVAVELPPDPDLPAKCVALEAFLGELRAQLHALRPSALDQPWVGKIISFYEESSS